MARTEGTYLAATSAFFTVSFALKTSITAILALFRPLSVEKGLETTHWSPGSRET